MPQKTNLNISPYFDDFDPDKNFYRVLFKPGYPVQARELTTLQSILQHQVESFGSHIFKEGSMVIPGGITYDDGYYSVKINQDHLGVDVTVYIKNLIDKRIQGQTSGIVAVIKNYSVPPNDDVATNVLTFPAPPTQAYPCANDAVNEPVIMVFFTTIKSLFNLRFEKTPKSVIVVKLAPAGTLLEPDK